MKTGLFLNQQNISSTNNNIKKADYLSKNSIKANLQQDTVSFSGSRSKRKKAAKEQANKQAYVIADDNNKPAPLIKNGFFAKIKSVLPWAKEHPGKATGAATGTIAAVGTAAYIASSLLGGGTNTDQFFIPPQPDFGTVATDYVENFVGTVADIDENYDTVNDIYYLDSNDVKTLKFTPNGLPEGIVMQNIVSPETAAKDDDVRIGSTLRELIDRAGYDFEGTYKEAGIDGDNDTDVTEIGTEGAFHKAIDEYLQSNPELVTLIVTINGVDSIDKLTPDQIADTPLLSRKDLLTSTRVIAPSFEIPYTTKFDETQKFGSNVIQKQFAPDEENTVVDIVSEGELKEGQYRTLEDAILDTLHIEAGSDDYKNYYNAIVQRLANWEENSEIIEVKTGDLREGDKVPVYDDTTRATALMNMTDIQGLHFPDNIVFNDITHSTEDVKYDYQKGSTIYQISPICPINGESVKIGRAHV